MRWSRKISEQDTAASVLEHLLSPLAGERFDDIFAVLDEAIKAIEQSGTHTHRAVAETLRRLEEWV
jgi:hypothetical protein